MYFLVEELKTGLWSFGDHNITLTDELNSDLMRIVFVVLQLG